MKEYYLTRLNWIFKYTRNNFFYCILKTLCILIGAPIYAVAFIGEMILTLVYTIFSWIPVLNIVIMIVCKAIIFLLDKPFYICILPDFRAYQRAMVSEPEYEVVEQDEADQEQLPQTDNIQ